MESDGTHPVPDSRICEQARISRDPRFDGLFFTAVTSTRIYCRPVCPVPTVRDENVRYYPSAAAAEAAGFRPCMRCRPELAPGAWPRGDALLERALKLIDEGLLTDRPLAELARRVNVGERQLRRLFVERLGASPLNVHRTRRLLFAKQLLTETTLPVTEVSLQSGFGSLRSFNASFRKAYRMAPGDLRRRPRPAAGDVLTLRLDFRLPYDFRYALGFLRARAAHGVEVVTAESYARTFGPPEAPGWLRLESQPGEKRALRLQLFCPRSARILEVVTRLRRMFDLDADPEAIGMALSRDDGLRPLLRRRPGLRLPGGWEGFEVAVRALLERHAGAAGARRLASALVQRHGQALVGPFPSGLSHLFPAPEALVESGPETPGLPHAGADTLRGIARALLEGRADFHSERTLEEFIERWTAIPGVDAFTAQTIALRALGHPDAFPADARALARRRAPTDSAGSLAARAESWRPWRAYAITLLGADRGRGRRSESDQPLRQSGARVMKSGGDDVQRKT